MDGNLARSVKKPTKIAKHAGRITFERLKKQNSYSARYVLHTQEKIDFHSTKKIINISYMPTTSKEIDSKYARK